MRWPMDKLHRCPDSHCVWSEGDVSGLKCLYASVSLSFAFLLWNDFRSHGVCPEYVCRFLLGMITSLSVAVTLRSPHIMRGLQRLLDRN